MELAVFSFDGVVVNVKREQEEIKKQAAAELLEYTDTFSKVGFTGLSMKNSTPDEIGTVVGMVSDVKSSASENMILFLVCIVSLEIDSTDAGADCKGQLKCNGPAHLSYPCQSLACAAPAFDYLENALAKFSSEGPFLLGNFGLVS